MDREDQVSMVHDYGMMPDFDSDSDCESSSCSGIRQSGEFSMDGVVKLGEDQSEHGVIRNSFVKGMGSIGDEINLVAIHKNSYSSVSGQARVEAFRIYSQAVAARRGGDANIKYAWYGGSRDEIRDIVNHGFVRFGDSEKSFSQGIGV